MCPLGVVAVAHDDNDAITVSWEQPPNSPPATSTAITYCPTSSPNCGKSMNCTSPCTFRGLDPDTEYQFTVIPNNNCASHTGCPGSSVTAQTTCKYSMTMYMCTSLYVSMSSQTCYMCYVCFLSWPTSLLPFVV